MTEIIQHTPVNEYLSQMKEYNIESVKDIMDYLMNFNSPYAIYTLIELLTDKEMREQFGLPEPDVQKEIPLLKASIESSNTNITNIQVFLKMIQNKYTYQKYMTLKFDKFVDKAGIAGFVSRFKVVQSYKWIKPKPKLKSKKKPSIYNEGKQFTSMFREQRQYSIQYENDGYEYGLSDW